MPYWDGREANADNLRLFIAPDGWRASADKVDEEGKITAQGSRKLIESIFLNALNATNLLILAGSGASFAARNPTPAEGQKAKLSPAGMTELWRAVRERAGAERFDAICAGFAAAPVDDNIERLLTLCKLHLELNALATDERTQEIKAFVEIAEAAILARADFVDRETELVAHSALLVKVGRRGVRKPRTKFFTTNYDLCFEEAARRHSFTLIDGFSHSLDQHYDATNFATDLVRRDASKEAPDFVDNVVHLYKVHGSIDWRRVGSDIVRTRSREGAPVLIYPRSSKFQEAFDSPYLDMLGAFQAALREPDTALIVSGFGFNDDHLSRPILSAVETNMSFRLVICDPCFLPSATLENGDHTLANIEPPNHQFLRPLCRLASAGDPRLSLLNGRFDDMALGLPDVVGETDRERHAARVRALREAPEA
jgi:SIR2-like domain